MDWRNTIKYRPVSARDIWSKKLLQKLSCLRDFKLAYTISGLWKFKTIRRLNNSVWNYRQILPCGNKSTIRRRGWKNTAER